MMLPLFTFTFNDLELSAKLNEIAYDENVIARPNSHSVLTYPINTCQIWQDYADWQLPTLYQIPLWSGDIWGIPCVIFDWYNIGCIDL